VIDREAGKSTSVLSGWRAGFAFQSIELSCNLLKYKHNLLSCQIGQKRFDFAFSK
jgi:hypothetical protein